MSTPTNPFPDGFPGPAASSRSTSVENKDGTDGTWKGVGSPSDEDRALASEVTQKFHRWREMKRPFEGQWFVNGAMLRDGRDVSWHDHTARLMLGKGANQRPINRTLPKVQNRRSRIIKPQGKPVVIPTTSNFEDALDAKGSEQALLYQHRRLKLVALYEKAVRWSEIGHKGFWAIGWDPSISSRIKLDDPAGGQGQIVEVPGGMEASGDITVEAVSPWEIFVPNLEEEELANQQELIRARQLHIEEAKARFPEHADEIVGDSANEEAFYYRRQLAGLTGRNLGGRQATKDDEEKNYVTLLEWFQRPTLNFPKGRYAVVASNLLLSAADELPYNFSTFDNPFPFVEFVDIPTIGQFWGTTLIEQLIGPQSEYNENRGRLRDYLRLCTQPHIFAPRHAQLGPGQMDNQAGRIWQYNWIPGIPSPREWVWSPPSISSDLWRALDLLRGEVEDVSQVFPVSEGKAGTTKSGFQANLLQEASDENIEPIRNAHARALQEAYYKIRRLMKDRYAVPRLLTIVGHQNSPEAFEFHAADVDERAEIEVQVATGLPDLKGARIQAVLDLFEKGLMGDPADPDVLRKTRSLLELGDVDQAIDRDKRDETAARLENTAFKNAQPIAVPMFYENHRVHLEEHKDALTSPEAMRMPPEQKQPMLLHFLQHISYNSPDQANALAALFGVDPMQLPHNQMMAAQQAAGMLPPPGAPPGPAPPAQAGPPQAGPPPGPPAPPPQAPPAPV